MKISEATSLSISILSKLGFSTEEAGLITQNLIEAELAEKKTHGFVRLLAIYNQVKSGKINVSDEKIETIKESRAVLHLDAKRKPGFYALYKSLELSLEKVKESGILGIAIKNMAYASGFIGDYARKAAEKDFIFIGFHNSPGGLIPHGTTKGIWGTNPITVSVPTHSIPVILDMASSQTTWGNLMVAKTEGKKLKEGIALDENGDVTTDPDKAIGILPIAGHKGSGLAFIVELLAGGLSNSQVGESVPGGWGSFYILIDPTLFRDLKEFKDEVQKAIEELKSNPKAKEVKEIYFPGEQSYLKREKNLKNGEIEVSENLLEKLKELI